MEVGGKEKITRKRHSPGTWEDSILNASHYVIDATETPLSCALRWDVGEKCSSNVGGGNLKRALPMLPSRLTEL